MPQLALRTNSVSSIPNSKVPLWKKKSRRKALLNERWFRDPNGKPQKNNWHHHDWFDLAEQHSQLLIEAAREHSKTQVFAITQPLAEIAINRNVRILLISDVFEKSQERCRVLREHIEKNEAYRADARDVRLARKDGDSKFWVERDYYWLKEATVTSTYAGAPISGGRYDIIIADDLINYLLNANTPGKRKKISRWFRDEVMNSVAENGKVWAIGTHQHHDDLYQELKKDARFKVRVYPAVDEEDTGYGSLGYVEKNKERGVTGDDALCLWSEKQDYEQHMAKKNDPASHDSYLRQQQQIAVPETGLVYRKALIDAALERGRSVEYDPEAAQYLGIDPGYANRAAMLAIQERTGDRVDLWAEHSFTQIGDEDIAKAVAEHCHLYGVEGILIDSEDPGLAASIQSHLINAGIPTPVHRIPFNMRKRQGIKATRWMLSTGRVAWKAEKTTVHRPGRETVEESIFRKEITSYALKDGSDDDAQKTEDHGPDAWVAYAARHIPAWLNATEQNTDE